MKNKKFSQSLKRSIRKQVDVKSWPATIVSAGKKAPFTKVKFTNGATMDVLNLKVANITGVKVRVGYDPLLPGQLQVLGVREIISPNGSANAWQYFLPNHHRTHEYPNHDVVWVDGAQIMPLNVLPLEDGLSVRVYGSVVWNGTNWYFYQGEDVDLSSYKPANGALWLLLSIDPDGETQLVITTGTTQGSRGVLKDTDIPTTPVGNIPVAAVMLYAGQVIISRDTRAGKRNDIVDMRWGNCPTVSATPFPTGGTEGQVLAKASNNDYDVEWADVSGGGGGTVQFAVDGALAALPNVPNAFVVVADTVIPSWRIYLKNTGTAGSTIVDINKNGTTIFTTQANRPTVAYNDADQQAINAPDVTDFVAGDVITLDIDQSATGAADLVCVGGAFGGTTPAATIVNDAAYGSDWDGDNTHAPSRNAVFDKINSMTDPSALVDDAAYGAGWDGDTSRAPSKNAVYDKIQAITSAVNDDAYGVGWDSDTTHAPSKNAIYDKIESMPAPSSAVSDAAYGAGWNGVTSQAPSKNAVYDKLEAMINDTAYADTWDADTTHAPSKNTIYDIIETVRSLIFHLQQSLSSLRAVAYSIVSSAAYGTGWGSDSQHAPSMKAVYDKIETMASTSSVDDSAYSSDWNGDATHSPSRNALYDKIETLGSSVPTVSNNIIEIQVFG
jgi:hypothetical protein